jgi:hypothetical protein
MSCWTGHSSGIHVQLMEMRFHAWATKIVRINFWLRINFAISDTCIFKVKQRERPDLERTVTYKHLPQNHMFDIPPSGWSRSSGTSSNSTPTPVLPNGVAPVDEPPSALSRHSDILRHFATRIYFAPTLLRCLSIFRGSELIGLHATCSASCAETHHMSPTGGLTSRKCFKALLFLIWSLDVQVQGSETFATFYSKISLFQGTFYTCDTV